jgi:hypothetical protein
MKKYMSMSVISLAVLSLIVGPALAQRANQGDQQSASQQQKFQQGQQKQVRGQVIRTKDVQVRQQGQNVGKNKVVMLETQDGQRLIVDLGSTKDAQRMNIQSGDQISVRGEIVRIGDRPVLMARQVQAQGQTMQVQRQQQGMTRQQAKQVTGQIKRMKEVNFRGTDQTNQVVLLETQQGRQLAVDLGNVQNLQDFNLQQGTQIQVQGKPVRIGDRMVLLANQLEANGQTMRISHPQPQQRSQQRTSQSQ